VAISLKQGLVQPAELAEQLVILIDGAMAVANREQSPQAARTAKTIAGILVKAHGGGSR
jgi:hypothetical protein